VGIDHKPKDEQEVSSSISVAAATAGNDRSCDVEATLSSSGVIQAVEDNSERSREMCVGLGKRDVVVIFTEPLFTQLYA